MLDELVERCDTFVDKGTSAATMRLLERISVALVTAVAEMSARVRMPLN
jgi:hypothetical protein